MSPKVEQLLSIFFLPQIGDCVLEVNGEDILGLRIAEVAQKVRLKAKVVDLLVWNASDSEVRKILFTG